MLGQTGHRNGTKMAPREEIVQNERLLHGFIAQASYLTKYFFFGDFAKCFSPIRLHDSSKCIISIKSSVNDLCVDSLQIVWDLKKLQIDYAFLVWYGRTYPYTQSVPKTLMTNISNKVESLS